MKQNKILNTTLVMIVIFALIVSFFIADLEGEAMRIFFLGVAGLALIFLVLGVKLIILAKKEKGKKKLFTCLTGLSAVAPLPGSILHNVFYALGIAVPALAGVFEVIGAAFFILALLVAPAGFIIGFIGVLVLFTDKDKKE